tara:strand:- start:293 stop:721 length:429 start_codon:yes stop_codon:yes gene_type:complete
MATTTASLSISSNIMSYTTNIYKTMTMKKLQSCNGLEETSGLRTKKFVNDTAVSIIEEDEYTDAKAHKVYIKNASSDKTNFFYVAFHASAAAATTAETIGKLYGGDWMLIPWVGSTNITVSSQTSEDAQYLEYMVFADGQEN